MKRRASLAGLFSVALLATLPAAAQTSWAPNAQLCAQLEGDLAQLQRGGSSASSRNFQKYDAAIHKQRAELDNAEARAKRDACYGGSVFLFRRTPKATCPALIKHIDKMKQNLAKLESKRNQYAPPPSDSGPMKAQILNQLAQAGCGEQYQPFAQPIRQQRRGLFGALFGNDYSIREYNLKNYDIPQIGTYRTVCVRSCDGFFFPISFSTTQSGFERDAQMCQSSCPGSDAQLYVYRNPGETSDEMVSLSGQPYQALETAYLYKKQYVQGCSCQAPASQLAAITNSDVGSDMTPAPQYTPRVALQDAPSLPSVPLPSPKQTAMIDPDTQDMARYGMKFEPYQPPEVSADASSVRTADGRSIRIVGPRFFGNQ
ncbi:DUF2865 domain-containing protein [uncultured Cohaesibacter sp.]|uniref:DUF2865 domain-containing protein n=1 Tax=uncultured Cohaesibacter sp. TaxID=1002546 RepID=UPI0029C88B65|nr:DUF2865 domain-containing protein [uncultured Cohaesibacter sp.]